MGILSYHMRVTQILLRVMFIVGLASLTMCGRNELIEKFCGSTWHTKLPKVEIMRQLCQTENIRPEELLIVGDGRSEIAAAVEIGAIALSRLDKTAKKQQEIHRKLGTNLIVSNYKNIQSIFEVK